MRARAAHICVRIRGELPNDIAAAAAATAIVAIAAPRTRHGSRPRPFVAQLAHRCNARQRVRARVSASERERKRKWPPPRKRKRSRDYKEQKLASARVLPNWASVAVGGERPARDKRGRANERADAQGKAAHR